MVPDMRICPVCHKRYDFNPDVGHFNCPYCHGLGKPAGNGPMGRFGKKAKTEGKGKK